MTYCPKCGNLAREEYNFCKFCGTPLNRSAPIQAPTQSSTQPVTLTPEDEMKNLITRRFECIKNRDENGVRSILDQVRYSKFDDWPPYGLQTAADALKNEFGAYKVLTNYNYEIRSFKAEAFGTVAIATFYLHYTAEMRRKTFDVYSRVTSVLEKQGSEWKIIHEHYSRFPEERKRSFLGI